MEVHPVHETEVLKLLWSMSGKTTLRDLISTMLLKEHSGGFATFIPNLAKLVFAKGNFPSWFRLAQVTLLLKKLDLSITDPASYRPISNLNITSKVLEHLYLARMISHFTLSVCPLQSAYRKLHSTKDGTLQDRQWYVWGDISWIILIAIDLSAAVDTIDYFILLSRHASSFKVTGLAPSWVRSYLSDWISLVKVCSALSPIPFCNTGVPQGSVLWPLLSCRFISQSTKRIASRWWWSCWKYLWKAASQFVGAYFQQVGGTYVRRQS